MPPAAILTSQTAHGPPIVVGPGSSNVLIGKKPALRLVDKHLCPLTPPPATHGVGTFVQGSSTVFINGSPAMRVGDKISEVNGGLNTVTQGESTVIIA